ncbi:MAG: hypothetical protein H0X25_16905 [Acidobacteriales bacterium]|nr:hypothetical protein [Terriglobales bacterium]
MPYAGVVFDQAGNLYGTTYGSTTGVYFGAVYKVDNTGHESVLHFLRARDGTRPFSAVLLDSGGDIYETNGEGSFGRQGSVLELNKLGEPKLLFSWGKLHMGTAPGSFPEAGLIRDEEGNLYGTTSLGGTGGGEGTVYTINHLTGEFTVVYSFGAPPDGCSPTGELVFGADGSLYGTTDIGGQYGWGTIFKVDPTSGAETVLYSFMDGADGGNPLSDLVEDSEGALYSTTAVGGAYGYGTVFKFDPTGQTLTTLHNFGSGGGDGATPFAGVTRDQAGNLYGTTTAGGTRSPGGRPHPQRCPLGAFSGWRTCRGGTLWDRERPNCSGERGRRHPCFGFWLLIFSPHG